MAKDFRQIRSQTTDVMRVQDNVRDRFQEISGLQILDGRITEELTLTTGQSNFVEHKLQREPLGWFVVLLDTDTNLWQASLDVRHIDIRVSATCKAKLWVF